MQLPETFEKDKTLQIGELSDLLQLQLSRWQELLVAAIFLEGDALAINAVEDRLQPTIRNALRVLNELPDIWAQAACERMLGV